MDFLIVGIPTDPCTFFLFYNRVRIKWYLARNRRRVRRNIRWLRRPTDRDHGDGNHGHMCKQWDPRSWRNQEKYSSVRLVPDWAQRMFSLEIEITWNNINGVLSKWSRTFIEFREFREYDKPMKHELGSFWRSCLADTVLLMKTPIIMF